MDIKTCFLKLHSSMIFLSIKQRLMRNAVESIHMKLLMTVIPFMMLMMMTMKNIMMLSQVFKKIILDREPKHVYLVVLGLV